MPTELWSASADGRFDCRMWEGGAVVYLFASGETHSLAEPASAVLATLLDEPDVKKSCGDWLLALSEAESAPNDDLQWQDDLLGLSGLLVDLERMNLVQRHAA